MKSTRNPLFEKQIKAQPQFQAGLRLTAKALVPVAQAAAPKRTGRYARGIKQIGTSLAGTDWSSHWVEWGSVNNPAYGTLRRAVISSGLRFVPNVSDR